LYKNKGVHTTKKKGKSNQKANGKTFTQTKIMKSTFQLSIYKSGTDALKKFTPSLEIPYLGV